MGDGSVGNVSFLLVSSSLDPRVADQAKSCIFDGLPCS